MDGARPQDISADLEEKLASARRELREVLEQQAATAEVLEVISRSPGELDPVFQIILANAMRICQAKFGNLVLYNGERFTTAAVYGAPPAFVRGAGATAANFISIPPFRSVASSRTKTDGPYLRHHKGGELHQLAHRRLFLCWLISRARALFSMYPCSRTPSWSALSLSTDRKFGRSPTSRSSCLRASQTRRSLPSRMFAC